MSRKRIKKRVTKKVNDACPHCGSYGWEPAQQQDAEDDPVNYFVACNDCGAQGPTGDDPGSAFKRWITRSKPDPTTKGKTTEQINAEFAGQGLDVTVDDLATADDLERMFDK
jgi:hypothetical protein